MPKSQFKNIIQNMKKSSAFIKSTSPTNNVVSRLDESAALVGGWLPGAKFLGLVQSIRVSAKGAPSYRVPFVKNARRLPVVVWARSSYIV